MATLMRCLGGVMLAVVGLAASAACSRSSSLTRAKHGDVVGLRRALEIDLLAGRLTRWDVVDIADALASYEVRNAKGPIAVQRIAAVKACAVHLEDEFDERAAARDDDAADAAMALLLVDKGSKQKWRKLASSSDPRWRAVGARTLTRSGDGSRRRELMIDPDEFVRLAAVRAAEDAKDSKDASLLLEAARLDPNPLVRVSALRGLQASANPETVLRLKDLWARGTEALRQGIVVAWSLPGMFEAGGDRELALVAQSTDGAPSVIAAGILMRRGGQNRGIGLSSIGKSIRSGLARDRTLAIAMADLDDVGLRDAVRRATSDKDPQVCVRAWARLADDPKERPRALEALMRVASVEGPASDAARDALARLGDPRVTKLLMDDASSSNPEVRAQVAASLIVVGDIGRAAFFLADPDDHVRLRTACTLITASARW